MRKLATIQTISDMFEADNADALEYALVRNWNVIVRKGDFDPEDKVIFIEPDAFLPVRKEFEFLRKNTFKTMIMPDGSKREGFRIRTVKLRGNISQGLIFHASMFGMDQYEVGTDVSEELDIILYETPLPDQDFIVAKFPHFIPKTDAERIQNITLEQVEGMHFFLTEKLDGTSCTVWYKDNEVGIASRNYQVADSGNIYAHMVNKYDIRNKLINYGQNIAIQFEIIGVGVQGNPLRLKDTQIRVFNVFDIDKQLYYLIPDVYALCKSLELPIVHVDTSFMQFDGDMFERYMFESNNFDVDVRRWLEDVDTYHSNINPDVLAEGYVFHSVDGNMRIKILSRTYEMNN